MDGCVLCAGKGEDVVYQSEKWRLIVAPEAEIPGFCRVIWMEHAAEMTDLSDADRSLLMEAVFLAERGVRDIMNPDKVNLAALGNMVPHIHWHIIPRYKGDRQFPDSVWSAPRRDRDEKALAGRAAKIPALKMHLKELFEKAFGKSR